MRSRFPVPLMILLLVTFIGGCFSARSRDECRKPEEYQASRSLPAIAVPAGLDTPDRSPGFAIPAGPVATGEPVDAGCLDQPPDYFARKPPVPAAPTSAPAKAAPDE